MHKWSRKPTNLGEGPIKDDWTILRDKLKVGRVTREAHANDKQSWGWHTWTYPPDSGVCTTLEEALELAQKAAGENPLARTPIVEQSDKTAGGHHQSE